MSRVTPSNHKEINASPATTRKVPIFGRTLWTSKSSISEELLVCIFIYVYKCFCLLKSVFIPTEHLLHNLYNCISAPSINFFLHIGITLHFELSVTLICELDKLNLSLFLFLLVFPLINHLELDTSLDLVHHIPLATLIYFVDFSFEFDLS